jgi:hypothetical protein
MTSYRPWKTAAEAEREDVESFAAYCVGSCHGDWSPKVDEIKEKVRSDPAVYAHYLEQWRRY